MQKNKIIPEKYIRCLWFSRHFKNINLKTLSNKKITILNTGRWNTLSEGPDFINAAILIDKKKLIGDVEIHRFSKDWYFHKHNNNPLYKNVILHVVFEHNLKKNYTEYKNKNIEILKISEFINRRQNVILKTIDISKYPYNCKGFNEICRPADKDTAKIKIKNLLYLLGKKRVIRKIRRFRYNIKKNSPEEYLYSLLFEINGYPANKNKFKKISKLFNFEKAFKLFKTSKGKTSFQKKFIKQILNIIQNHNINFKISGIREQNRPLNRLKNLGLLIYYLCKEFNTSAYFFKNAPVEDILLFKKYFLQILSKCNYGKDYSNIIIYNGIIPYFIVAKNKKYYKFFYNYTILPVNHKIKFIKKIFSIKKIDKEIYQQGCIELYDKYCNNKNIDCNECILNSKKWLADKINL